MFRLLLNTAIPATGYGVSFLFPFLPSYLFIHLFFVMKERAVQEISKKLAWNCKHAEKCLASITSKEHCGSRMIYVGGHKPK